MNTSNSKKYTNKIIFDKQAKSFVIIYTLFLNKIFYCKLNLIFLKFIIRVTVDFVNLVIIDSFFIL